MSMIYQVVAYLSSSQDCHFLKIFKSEFLIEDLISRLLVNENGIYQNLSLGVDNQKPGQKQIKF